MTEEFIKKVWFSVGNDTDRYDHNAFKHIQKFTDIEDYVDYYISDIAEEYDRFLEEYCPNDRTFKFYLTEDGPCVYEIDVASEAVVNYYGFSGRKL